MNPALGDRTNGQTIDQTWFNLIKSNLTNLWSGLAGVQNETREFQFVCNAPLEHLSAALPKSGFIMFPVLDNITLLNAYVRVYDAGTSGTLCVGWDFKRGAGAWTSVLTTNPSSVYTDGSLYTSTNGAVNNLYDDLVVGDWLRLNLITLQSKTSPNFFKYWSAHLTFQRT